MLNKRNSYSKFSLIYFTAVIGGLISFTSCSVSRTGYTPTKKYTPSQLQYDYSIFRGLLEETHPGMYWYTPKEEMDRYFDLGKKMLNDSMTEGEFRKTLSYVIAKINCGHTVIRNSKEYFRFRDTVRPKVFPLSLKLWDSSAAIASNLNRNDSILKRGTIIKAINRQPVSTILDTLFKYISSDGYNFTHKYQTLSNRGGFGSAYTSIFGLKENYYVDYVDSTGSEKEVAIKPYDPKADTLARSAIRRFERIPKEERKKQLLLFSRSLQFDSTKQIAFMDLSSFSKGLKLKKFYRQSFRSLRRSKTKNLVIDVRGNGGGSVTNSTVLTKFIADKKFKVADSLYARNRNSHYKKYIENYFFNRLFMLLMTRKRSDGNYHFGYFERHYFKPKKVNHFGNNVYIVTGGNSFSATTLFLDAIKSQKNVLVVGEETGGGAYGNTAWLIPEVTLPKTGVRFRLPLFRLVINKDLPHDGRGVQPDIESKPTIDAIRLGIDYKFEKVMELIKANQSH